MYIVVCFFAAGGGDIFLFSVWAWGIRKRERVCVCVCLLMLWCKSPFFFLENHRERDEDERNETLFSLFKKKKIKQPQTQTQWKKKSRRQWALVGHRHEPTGWRVGQRHERAFCLRRSWWSSDRVVHVFGVRDAPEWVPHILLSSR